MTTRRPILESQRESDGTTTVLLTCGHEFRKRYPLACAMPKTAVCEACTQVAIANKLLTTE